MAVPIPPYTQDEIDAFELEECGVRVNDSPSINIEIDQSNLTREFMCRFDRFQDVMKFFLGWARTYEDSGTTKLSRLLPQRDADFPDFIATKVFDAKGHQWVGNKFTAPPPEEGEDPPGYVWSPGAQANTFSKMRFKVLFEQRIYELLSDEDTTSERNRFVSLDSTEPSAEILTMPGACFKYQKEGGGGPSNKTIAYNIGKLQPLEVRKISWHRLPENVWEPGSDLYDRIYGNGGLVAMMGTVNQVEFKGYPAGTLLLTGVRPQRLKVPFGSGWEYTLQYEFTYKPSGWLNAYFFDKASTDSGYYYVSADGSFHPNGEVPDDTSVYNETDFEFLFRVGV